MNVGIRSNPAGGWLAISRQVSGFSYQQEAFESSFFVHPETAYLAG